MLAYTADNISEWKRLGMRGAFGNIMIDIAREHEELMVLTADLTGSAGLGEYAKVCSEQFCNVGIAEQNMTGIAAGLAKEGRNVFITSFAPFVSMRAFEAVHTLVGYMHLNVKVVALASGTSSGIYGNTHYGMEDVALMRTIPGMQVLVPADCLEMAECLEHLAGYEGPAYLRLTGLPRSPSIYKESFPFEAGKSVLLREGEDAVMIANGHILHECIRAARPLSKAGVSCAVVDMHTVKPLDTAMLDEACGRYKLIVTVEDHCAAGGLGGAVAEYLARKDDHPPLLILGIEDVFPHAGTYSYVLQQCGLSAQTISERIAARLGAKL